VCQEVGGAVSGTPGPAVIVKAEISILHHMITPASVAPALYGWGWIRKGGRTLPYPFRPRAASYGPPRTGSASSPASRYK
jgi:hypothetical protein